ncbi:MAG TPA: AraC family transcriptional regulator [Burkholderiaceae bacterium]|nr:AraC family transcriptional regulator [Burkholderiaceae bacterium]
MRSVPATSLSVRDYGASRGSHAHEHFQVLVGLQGMLELEVEGRGQRVGEGQGVVVAPGDRHDFEAAHGGSRCLVLDTSDVVWAAHAGHTPIDARVGALARYLALSLERETASALALLQGPALLREAWGPGEPVARGHRPIDWPALVVWLRTHWHLPLTVADLARQVHLSPSQFSERCRQHMGVSPMQWLRGQRLAQARALRLGGMGVAEAARRTGYRSPSALTAAMRRTT